MSKETPVEVTEFEKELHGLFDSRSVSASKMDKITRLAIKSARYYKNIVYLIEKFITRCVPEYKLTGLYVLDSICRSSQTIKSKGAGSSGFTGAEYVDRFERNIEALFAEFCKVPEDKEKEKVKRVVEIWERSGTFSPSVVDSIRRKYFDRLSTKNEAGTPPPMSDDKPPTNDATKKEVDQAVDIISKLAASFSSVPGANFASFPYASSVPVAPAPAPVALPPSTAVPAGSSTLSSLPPVLQQLQSLFPNASQNDTKNVNGNSLNNNTTSAPISAGLSMLNGGLPGIVPIPLPASLALPVSSGVAVLPVAQTPNAATVSRDPRIQAAATIDVASAAGANGQSTSALAATPTASTLPMSMDLFGSGFDVNQISAITQLLSQQKQAVPPQQQPPLPPSQQQGVPGSALLPRPVTHPLPPKPPTYQSPMGSNGGPYDPRLGHQGPMTGAGGVASGVAGTTATSLGPLPFPLPPFPPAQQPPMPMPGASFAQDAPPRNHGPDSAPNTPPHHHQHHDSSSSHDRHYQQDRLGSRDRYQTQAQQHDRHDRHDRSPHDRRAGSTFKGKIEVREDPHVPPDTIKVLSRTLWVGGAFIPTISEEELSRVFEPYGQISSLIGNAAKFNAFIKMMDREQAEQCKQHLDRTHVQDEVMKVGWGCGFGPRDCFDYTAGSSLIPLRALTDTDRRWLSQSAVGGFGPGQEIRGGVCILEPNIEPVGPDGREALPRNTRSSFAPGGRGGRGGGVAGGRGGAGAGGRGGGRGEGRGGGVGGIVGAVGAVRGARGGGRGVGTTSHRGGGGGGGGEPHDGAPSSSYGGKRDYGQLDRYEDEGSNSHGNHHHHYGGGRLGGPPSGGSGHGDTSDQRWEKKTRWA
ncbi:hypothetical protein BGZ73_004955 [Actinomortierella ambigua]|nr:hypothetical protein BGZ73_004955 [Actinomortierella ambigua]